MTSGLISGMTAGYDFQTMLDTDLECSYKIGILCETQLSAEDRLFYLDLEFYDLDLNFDLDLDLEL